jgi:hypothetical protein
MSDIAVIVFARGFCTRGGIAGSASSVDSTLIDRLWITGAGSRRGCGLSSRVLLNMATFSTTLLLAFGCVSVIGEGDDFAGEDVGCGWHKFWKKASFAPNFLEDGSTQLSM